MNTDDLEKMIKSLWVNQAIKDCYVNLEQNKEASAFETQAGCLLSMDGETPYQVKIIVTRNEEEFLGDFDHVEHKAFG